MRQVREEKTPASSSAKRPQAWEQPDGSLGSWMQPTAPALDMVRTDQTTARAPAQSRERGWAPTEAAEQTRRGRQGRCREEPELVAASAQPSGAQAASPRLTPKCFGPPERSCPAMGLSSEPELLPSQGAEGPAAHGLGSAGSGTTSHRGCLAGVRSP